MGLVLSADCFAKVVRFAFLGFYILIVNVSYYFKSVTTYES